MAGLAARNLIRERAKAWHRLERAALNKVVQPSLHSSGTPTRSGEPSLGRQLGHRSSDKTAKLVLSMPRPQSRDDRS
jgi:hypothetical protein